MQREPALLSLIGAASGLGAQIIGCADGPEYIKNSSNINQLETSGVPYKWLTMIHAENNRTDKTKNIHDWCKQIANITAQLAASRKPFCVIGGDHSCAIGTWSGVASALTKEGALGLIWIDAHLDSHTFETTPSQAIHGMPAAALLGHGNSLLTQLISPQPKILPENICFIGARSYEEGEHSLLKRLGVKIFYMEDIQNLGLPTVIEQARAIVSQNTTAFGMSIDLDAVDPQDACGFGSPEPNGISALPLMTALKGMGHQPNFIGYEIVEFNPHLDVDNKTEKLIYDLIKSISGEN